MNQAEIKIPAELFALAESSRFEGVLDMPTLDIGPDEYRFAEPLSWNVDVTNTGSAFLVAGRVTASATVPCSRCLEDVDCDFDAAIEGYFLVEGAENEDADVDEDVGEDEFDVLPADHIIDLEPLIRAALIVDAPQMPLCREDCAGLCQTCGANLNEGACGCVADDSFEQAANPFAALADYTFE